MNNALMFLLLLLLYFYFVFLVVLSCLVLSCFVFVFVFIFDSKGLLSYDRVVVFFVYFKQGVTIA